MRKTQTLALALVVVALAVLASGCDRDKIADVFRKSPTAPDPEPPAPIAVILAGECHVLGATIQCEDGSSPIDGIASVRWTLRNSTTGLTVASKAGEVGGIVEFAGLAPGIYSVEQEVTPTVGEVATEIYGGLEVIGGG